MDNTWFIQFNKYHVYFRISGCNIENNHQQESSLFEETAQITIMSGLSYFPVFSKRSWIAIGPRLQKPVCIDL